MACVKIGNREPAARDPCPDPRLPSTPVLYRYRCLPTYSPQGPSVPVPVQRERIREVQHMINAPVGQPVHGQRTMPSSSSTSRPPTQRLSTFREQLRVVSARVLSARPPADGSLEEDSKEDLHLLTPRSTVIPLVWVLAATASGALLLYIAHLARFMPTQELRQQMLGLALLPFFVSFLCLCKFLLACTADDPRLRL
jgi:hypothetical protein